MNDSRGREQDIPRFTMLLHRVVLLWPLMMSSESSATEDSEGLSPLAKNIIATLSSSGNAVHPSETTLGPGPSMAFPDVNLFFYVCLHCLQCVTHFAHLASFFDV